MLWLAIVESSAPYEQIPFCFFPFCCDNPGITGTLHCPLYIRVSIGHQLSVAHTKQDLVYRLPSLFFSALCPAHSISILFISCSFLNQSLFVYKASIVCPLRVVLECENADKLVLRQQFCSRPETNMFITLPECKGWSLCKPLRHKYLRGQCIHICNACYFIDDFTQTQCWQEAHLSQEVLCVIHCLFMMEVFWREGTMLKCLSCWDGLYQLNRRH